MTSSTNWRQLALRVIMSAIEDYKMGHGPHYQTAVRFLLGCTERRWTRTMLPYWCEIAGVDPMEIIGRLEWTNKGVPKFARKRYWPAKETYEYPQRRKVMSSHQHQQSTTELEGMD